MNIPNLALKDSCTGCMACSDACHKTSALTITLDTDGHYYPKVDPESCIGCKLCEKVCPLVSNLKYNDSSLSEAFAAWNTDKEQRKQSASGGIFAAMASKVIDEGGVVYGAAIDGICDVKHIMIDRKDELYKLQGSKYTQSYTSGIYSQVWDCLKNGRLVLFSGTGCQVAGLYGFIGLKKYTGKLITVDLICGGVPSKLLLEKFVENEPYNIKRVLSFRTKETGWRATGFRYNLKVEDTEGNIHDYTGKRNLLTDGFSSELTNRLSCYDCKFAGLNRMSDFTIGDLWGDTHYPEQHYDGLSIIIAHNQNAVDWLHSADAYITIDKLDINEAVKTNFRILEGHEPNRKFWERRHMEWLFQNCSYTILKKIYALDFSNTSPWILYKIYKVLRNKICK